MAAAIALKKLGIDDVVVLERNARLGGILNQCIHPGFGLARFGRDLTGPEYARALEREFVGSGAEYALGAMVLGISESRVLRVISKNGGYAEIRATAIIVATGCRERTRENLEIAGTRPAGVFTAGQAQNLINLRGYRLGEHVVIQGSGDIGLIMARRLTIEGYRVDCVFERLPYLSGLIRNKVQCLDHFGIPLHFGAQICEIAGRRRVEGVWIERVDAQQRPVAGTREYHPCDTVLFSVGLIPEVDILKSAGMRPPLGHSIGVNSHFEAGGTDSGGSTGIFLCGNALHIHDLADNASKEGELVASHVALYLRSRDDYAASGTENLPYRPIQADTRFDASWFARLGGCDARVCIVCPRGCIVSDREATCPRGAAYYAESKRGNFQPMTATIASSLSGKRMRIPVRSLDPVEVSDIPLLKKGLVGAGAQRKAVASSAGSPTSAVSSTAMTATTATTTTTTIMSGAATTDEAATEADAATTAAVPAVDGESLLPVKLDDRDVMFSLCG